MDSHSISLSKKINLIVVFFGMISASAATADQEAKYAGNLPYDPKIEGQVLNYITKAGYTAEDHIVETEDGYLLTLHRLVNESGPPIFIQHGLLSSSDDWLTIGERRQLPYLLADLGYDVWMGNYRGNSFSHAHVSLSTNDTKYWDFSWHEMGIYDLPAMIDYVINYRGKSEKLIYIGHSMGTTGVFVMSSERPDMQDKVKLIICLAPVAYMSNMESPLRLLAPFTDALEAGQKLTHDYDLLSRDELINRVLKFACALTTLTSLVCTSLLFAICGFDPQQLDYDQLKVIASRTIAGSSTKSLVHYLQEVKSQKFRQYDYEEEENMKRYGTATPPEYDITKLFVPMAFIYGDNDWLAAVSDVKQLYQILPNGIAMERVNSPTFNHLGFLWAKDAIKLVYEPIIELIKNYD